MSGFLQYGAPAISKSCSLFASKVWWEFQNKHGPTPFRNHPGESMGWSVLNLEKSENQDTMFPSNSKMWPNPAATGQGSKRFKLEESVSCGG